MVTSKFSRDGNDDAGKTNDDDEEEDDWSLLLCDDDADFQCFGISSKGCILAQIDGDGGSTAVVVVAVVAEVSSPTCSLVASESDSSRPSAIAINLCCS